MTRIHTTQAEKSLRQEIVSKNLVYCVAKVHTQSKDFMAKPKTGRLSGLDGMRRFSASELLAWANALENQINDPQNQDDPKWLRRWAEDMRRLARQKEKAQNHKNLQR